MQLKVLDGWLKDDLERASARVREWEAKPIVQAQIKRAAEVAAKKWGRGEAMDGGIAFWLVRASDDELREEKRREASHGLTANWKFIQSIDEELHKRSLQLERTWNDAACKLK